MNFVARLRTLSLTVALCGASFLAFAQPERDGPPADRPGQSDRAPRLGRPQQRGEPDRPRTDIRPEDQRQAIREAFQRAQEKSRDVAAKMREARARLQDAIWAERVNEEAIRDRVHEVARLETELAMIRAHAIASVRPKLTPQQIERLRNMGNPFEPRLRAPGAPIREQIRERIVERRGPGPDQRPAPRDGLQSERRPLRQVPQGGRRGPVVNGRDEGRAPRGEMQDQRRPMQENVEEDRRAPREQMRERRQDEREAPQPPRRNPAPQRRPQPEPEEGEPR